MTLKPFVVGLWRFVSGNDLPPNDFVTRILSVRWLVLSVFDGILFRGYDGAKFR